MIRIDLSGKPAVITGASGQLGRVMARTSARARARAAPESSVRNLKR